jgi:D-alanyl-D-alanine carboxypeptidase
LDKLLAAAEKDKLNLYIISSHRSQAYQQKLFDGSVKNNGLEHALKYVARPGGSQHHLGTAVDFNNVNKNFAQTKEYKWLLKNAGKYGFSLSYPDGAQEKTGFVFEPWHYRYIGESAVKLQDTFFNGSQYDTLAFLHKCVFTNPLSAPKPTEEENSKEEEAKAETTPLQ